MQLSAWLWVRLRQVFVVEGVDSVCVRSDRCQLFSLELAILDNMSALTFSYLQMCWMHTRSKAYWMTFQTR